MAFNQANVDNRLRHLVRGRVIVATNSRTVEYLEESLKTSYPLYSFDSIPSDRLAVFMVEFNGYLTFDEDCVVKITQESNAFERTYFDPTAFTFVRQADTFTSLIKSVSPALTDEEDAIEYFNVDYTTPTGQIRVHLGPVNGTPIPVDSAQAATYYRLLAPNSAWRGPTAYNGLKLLPII